MIKYSVNFILVLLFTSCSTLEKNNYDEAKSDYKKAADKLVSMVNSSDSSKSSIMEQSLLTIDLAKPLMNGYAKRFSNCKILTDFILSKENDILNSTPEKLEVNYHEGNSLPDFDPDCHDIKEVIVHPATVYSLAKFKNLKDSKEQMIDEMEEVLMHLDSL